MDQSQPCVHYLKDYRVSDFLIESVHLHFDLDEEDTIVKSILAIKRNPLAQNPSPNLQLDGENLQLREVKLDGHSLSQSQFKVSPLQLEVFNVPESFILETEVLIKPPENTQLMGLYKSSGNFCSHCESRGFRRITYYLDRPDIMSHFITTISADKDKYPMLLSNGNLLERKELANGRHWVHWEDPSLKPSYLFALVAGDFDLLEDQFVTFTGKTVALRVYVEKGFGDQGSFALEALKLAMKWDEVAFGREYDLDIYMIVAVSDFTMGAMENKGLNVFNTKYILAKPETATDFDYLNVVRVIGHEYFHNWSGNRITCRDWFQITLKEGLTVLREQLFMYDQTNPALSRLDEVNLIRNHQFLEDNGPNAHPIRPDNYIEVNNFYTVTVYHKGAEVIGMIRTLLGKEGFRKAMDLYFSRYDGQAVTTEDFLQAMSDASGRDLSQFKRWYSQAGTPKLEVTSHYDEKAKRYELTIKQSCDPTPNQPVKQPFHIPFAVGLIDSQGNELNLQLENSENKTEATTCILEIKEPQETFRFVNIAEKPIPSLLREFSAPVKLHYDYTDHELAQLFKHDKDFFSRWDAGQELMTRLLMKAVVQVEEGQTVELDELLKEAFLFVLKSKDLDFHLGTRLLSLPTELYLSQQKTPAPVIAIHQARDAFKEALGKKLQEPFLLHYQNLHQKGEEYVFNLDLIGKRGFKNSCLFYLVNSKIETYAELAYQQFKLAKHMTDKMGALVALNDSASPLRAQALEEFYRQSETQPLLINKWLSLEASSSLDSTLFRVKELLSHPAFSIKNPNNVYALIVVFSQNMANFHRADGLGYEFVCDQVLTVDHYNSQVSARLVQPLTYWSRFDLHRQQLMKGQLERILKTDHISSDVFELVSKSLEQG